MKSIEKTGTTVEQAIAAGLEELGANPSDVMVEVLEEPTNGLMGLGAKPARVKIILMNAPMPPPPAPASNSPQADDSAQSIHEPSSSSTASSDRSSEDENRRDSSRDRQGNRDRNDRNNRNDRNRNSRGDRSSNRSAQPQERYDLVAEPAPDAIATEDADEVAIAGREALDNILIHMGFEDAHVTMHRAESTDPKEEMHWVLNVHGTSLDSLIGRRGETLASLQYIVRLIVSRTLQEHASLIVDVGQFKARRSEKLMQMAHRLADQAVADERTISLEPMPPHERRIVHLALRERPDVETFSVGEGKTRKVTIAPNLE